MLKFKKILIVLMGIIIFTSFATPANARVTIDNGERYTGSKAVCPPNNLCLYKNNKYNDYKPYSDAVFFIDYRYSKDRSGKERCFNLNSRMRAQVSSYANNTPRKVKLYPFLKCNNNIYNKAFNLTVHPYHFREWMPVYDTDWRDTVESVEFIK